MTPREGDRAAVTETLYRYALGVDSRDWDLYRAQFADRIRVDFSGITDTAPAEMDADDWVAGVAAQFASLHATHHMMSNPLVDIATDGATARLRMYVQATHVRDPDDPASFFTVGGAYDTDLVREGDRWLLTGVKLTVTWSRGAPSVLAPPDGD